MKTRKRVLTLVLALLLCAALAVPVSADGDGAEVNANVHWLDVEVPEGYELLLANYVKELGILSCEFANPQDVSMESHYIVMNIDLATGKRTQKYGNYVIYPFSCGRAQIRDVYQGWGYMDLSGNVVIEPKYVDAYVFSEGYAVVSDFGDNLDEGLYKGYIDVNGNDLFRLQNESLDSFSDGVAVVRTGDGQWGVIDTQFNYVIEPGEYDSIEPFVDDQAAAIAIKDGMPYIINKKGELAYPNVYNNDFDIVWCTKPNKLILVYQDGQCGYVNHAGEFVVPLQYSSGEQFSDGLARVWFRESGVQKTGFVDETGKLAFVLDTDALGDNWELAGSFKNGYQLVEKRFTGEDGNVEAYFTLIDKTGKICFDWERAVLDRSFGGDIEWGGMMYVSVEENGLIMSYAGESYDGINHHYYKWYDTNGNYLFTSDDHHIFQLNSAVRTPVDDLAPYVDWEYFAVIENGRLGWFNYEEDYLGAVKKQPQVSDLADVHPGDWYYDVVKWAVENEITDPLTDTSFGVEVPASREEIVLDLWRACKCPEPQGTVSPFIDMTPANEGYKAILWAYENNIVNGVGDDRFDPSGTLTRADAATILWRAASNPEPASAAYPFQDIPAGVYYEKPVVWAYENGIANGTSANSATFSPDDNVLREQMVAFLYRWLVQPAK